LNFRLYVRGADQSDQARKSMLIPSRYNQLDGKHRGEKQKNALNIF
jgi:hypothetical protein